MRCIHDLGSSILKFTIDSIYFNWDFLSSYKFYLILFILSFIKSLSVVLMDKKISTFLDKKNKITLSISIHRVYRLPVALHTMFEYSIILYFSKFNNRIDRPWIEPFWEYVVHATVMGAWRRKMRNYFSMLNAYYCCWCVCMPRSCSQNHSFEENMRENIEIINYSSRQNYLNYSSFYAEIHSIL